MSKCDFCSKESDDCRETVSGKWFCDYECMESYYGDEVPEDEEFNLIRTLMS